MLSRRFKKKSELGLDKSAVEVETGVHRKLSEMVNAGQISDEDKRKVLGNLALAESLTPEAITASTAGVSNAAKVHSVLLTLLRDPAKEVAPPPPAPETPVSVASEVRKTTEAQLIEEKAGLFDALLGKQAGFDGVAGMLKKALAVLELERVVGA